MHGLNYQGEDPTGWIMSEKLDGIRAYWDGVNLYSKKGVKS
jgi:DNA ligase-1